MTQLMDVITQAMSGDAKKQIGRQLGTDERGTQAAISAALPMLISALARNTADPNGARALDTALAKDHDGSILENLGGVLGSPEQGPGAGILRHVLGDRQPLAEQAVSNASGLDSKRAGQVLLMLAPIVMGALGRARQQGNVDASGLASMLGDERERLGQTSPDLMGMATKMFDSNKDGSIVDDLGNIAGKLFGKR